MKNKSLNQNIVVEQTIAKRQMPEAARSVALVALQRALAACAVALSIVAGSGAWAQDAEDSTVAAQEAEPTTAEAVVDGSEEPAAALEPEESAPEEPLPDQPAPSEDDEGKDETQEADEDKDRPAGANCAGQPEARWVYNQLLVLRYNSMGADYRGRVGVCVPFLTGRGKLFDLSNLEFGIAHELSPAFGHLGGYVGFAPLSILSFRVQATGLLYWELPLDRSAYFPVDGYGANIGSDHYPHEQGQTESGWNVSFVVKLQVKFPIGPVALIGLDSFAYEFWSLGDSDQHYINLRHDIVMAGYDRVIANEAMLMLEVPLPKNMAIRFGAYDSLRWVADAVHQNHNIGAVAMLTWPELPRGVRGLTIFLRVGWYADRSPADAGPTVVYIGLLSTYDLGSALSRSRDK